MSCFVSNITYLRVSVIDMGLLAYSLHDVAHICYLKGLREVVLSPGSRCAPLALAFYRHQGIRVIGIEDERSAAFIALGIALGTGRIVGLVCTSGSAPLHYAPALSEAMYGNVPLLVLSADRPLAWIGQGDGQSIVQRDLYGAQVKASDVLPYLSSSVEGEAQIAKESAWHAARIIDEHIDIALRTPKGPVHINVPLTQPLYVREKPKSYAQEKTPCVQLNSPCVQLNSPCVPLPIEKSLTEEAWHTLQSLFDSHSKVLLIGGQHPADMNLLRRLEDFIDYTGAVALGEVTSNLHGIPQMLRQADGYLYSTQQKALRPEIAISFGGSILSSSLKQFLRQSPLQAHLILSPAEKRPADIFQSLTHHICLPPSVFFRDAIHALKLKQSREVIAYNKLWHREEKRYLSSFKKSLQDLPFGSLYATSVLIRSLPNHAHLHLGNSMPIRYAQAIGVEALHEAVEIYANRGTNGIDGCLSTALGVSWATQHVLNVLLIGDVSLFHDAHALLRVENLPKNLRIVVLNDGGSGIFRLIEGAKAQEAWKDCFVMPKKSSAEALSKHAKISYLHARNGKELEKAFAQFFRPSTKAALLEVFVEGEVDMAVYKKVLGARRL